MSKDNQICAQLGANSLVSVLQALLRDVILSRVQTTNRYKFRKLLISDARVIELLNRNNSVILQAFNYFTHTRKSKTVSLEECCALAR